MLDDGCDQPWTASPVATNDGTGHRIHRRKTVHGRVLRSTDKNAVLIARDKGGIDRFDGCPRFRSFNRPSDDGRLLEWKERLTNSEHCALRAVDILFKEEITESDDIALRSCRQDYPWHTGIGASGFF